MRKFITTVAVAVPLFASSAAFAVSPQSFLAMGIQGDNSEIMLGQMAQQRGGSRDVQEFGRMLVQDHTMAKQQKVAAAQAAGIRVRNGVMPEAAAEARRLKRLRGAKFDAEFVNYMIEDHQKDISEFEAQAQQGDATGQLAQAQLPALRAHLAAAQKLMPQQ